MAAPLGVDYGNYVPREPSPVSEACPKCGQQCELYMLPSAEGQAKQSAKRRKLPRKIVGHCLSHGHFEVR